MKQWKNFRAADLFGAFLLLLALGALLFVAAFKVIAQSPPSNAAPVANAGPDQTVRLPDQAILRGWAVDDGLPNSPGTLIYEWSVISGPDAVTFGNAAAASTTAAFTSEGIYMLQLTASDGELSGNDTVVVTVYAAPSPPPSPTPTPTNQAPIVNAGPDQTITVLDTATLRGWATDDGLPNPPANLTYQWSLLSGPGAVNFGNAAAASTKAAFSTEGNYSLRLTAFDGASSGVSDVAVTVEATPTPTSTPTETPTPTRTSTPTPTNMVATPATEAWANGSEPTYSRGGAGLRKKKKRCSLPGFNPVAGRYTANSSGVKPVVISDATIGSSVRYTKNGTTPTSTSGTLISPPNASSTPSATIQLPVATTTLKAIAFKTGLTDSAIQNGVYIISRSPTPTPTPPPTPTPTATPVVATPVFSPSPGSYTANSSGVKPVILSDPTIGASVRYTQDGSAPTANTGTLISPPNASSTPRATVQLPVATTTLKAVGFKTGSTNSAVQSGVYIVSSSPTPSPSATPTPTPGASDLTLINCGGPAYVDSVGQSWSADKYFAGGTSKIYSATVSGTADPKLYQSERFGKTLSYQIPVANGNYEVTLDFTEMFWNAAGKRVFDVSIQGQTILQDFDIWALAGAHAAVQRTFVVTVTNGTLSIGATATVDNATLSAIQILFKAGDLYLHPIVTLPSYAVDYDGTGSAVVPLNGDRSHTHQSGHNLKTWSWKEGTTAVGTGPDLSVSFPIGQHSVTLTIMDDNSPARTSSDTGAFTVTPVTVVPGALTSYYPSDGISITQLIDSLPSLPGYMEVTPSLEIDNIAGNIGGSPFSSNVVLVMDWKQKVTTAATYRFTLNGGSATRLFLNGSEVSTALSLQPGTYTMQARFAIASSTALPVRVLLSMNGAPAAPVNPTNITHDETRLKPFINNMPTTGSPLGSDAITIAGIGFFPAKSVSVHWGGITLSASALAVTPTSIQFMSPPGSGTINVSVETPNGTSNSSAFKYVQGTVPVSFTAPATIATLTSPTQAVWGQDGRLYVGSDQGNITIYTFGDDYTVTNTQVVTAIAGLSNPSILGITVNPRDPPSPVKIYVAHSQLYAEGGGAFTGPAPYNGQVSVLTGPNFSTVKPLITGLPVSNRDHAINGLAFDDAGNLLICVGSETNAGVPSLPMGTLPNCPLDAAILTAPISKTGFNGSITYVETATGKPNNDQVYGDRVDVAPGVDVSVFASGMRNPFGIVWTTGGKLFGTDNGMNANFGAVSTGANTQTTESNQPDEINYIVAGRYYGSPNRNRGRYDPRQNVYHYPTEVSTSAFTAPLARVASSSDGIDEYRATTFNSEMRGNLLVQRWKGVLNRVVLAADGQSIQSVSTLASTLGLTALAGPGGVILSMDYSHNQIVLIRPIDDAATSMVAYDIFPWRGRADGTVPFVIGGVGFGTLSGTTVTIGGTRATLTSISATRIKGLIPANAAPTTQLLDVVVQSSGKTSTISQAFRYN